MKPYKIFATVVIAASILCSCDKHDSLDDAVIVGPKAPQVYWEVGSSTVTAGSEVPFTAQYYTTSDVDINRLEVWYNIIEKEAKTITCPWITSFVYNVSVSKESEKRISQKIKEYAHNVDLWQDSCRAYTFSNSFPTSNTLSSFSWVLPQECDTTDIEKYFGKEFKENFKDSLFGKMVYKDFETLIQGIYPDTSYYKHKVILEYKDSTFDKNSNSWQIHFPKDEATGLYPVPEEIKTVYYAIPFDSLILNASKQYYDIQYTRQYYINANIRCIDENGVYGEAIMKSIDLN